jgi:hypothetical protein
VSDAERQLIVKLARARGIADGSPADRQLSAWLAASPGADLFARSTRLIRAMLSAQAPGGSALSPGDLVRHCEEIAAASGGILGMKKISTEERALISEIAAALKSRGD